MAYDCFAGFQVGDIVGIGVNPESRRLYITLNGEVFRSDVVCEKIGAGMPTFRLRGGPCKFIVNFGESPFAFSPYSFSSNTSAQKSKIADEGRNEKERGKN